MRRIGTRRRSNGFSLFRTVPTNCLAVDAGNVAAWLFDEADGEVTVDVTGHNHDGTMLVEYERVKGKFGSAIDFPDEGGSIEIPGMSAGFPPRQVAIVAWVKMQQLERQENLFNMVPEGPERARVLMPWDDQIFWSFGVPTDFVIGIVDEDLDLKNERRHWAFVNDGDENLMAMYMDRVKFRRIRGISSEFVARDGTFHIGDAAWPFSGVVDKVPVLDVTLAEADLPPLMERGLAATYGLRPVAPAGKLATTWAALKPCITAEYRTR